MNIYAVRDRLIDYYMQPFVGPNDKEVMAALARTVNNIEDTNGIAQAPHHFELWELGTIDEEGNITPTRKLVCDCASLIRAGLRERPTAGRHPAGSPPGLSQNAPDHLAGGAHANDGSVPNTPPAAPGKAEEVLRGHPSGYPVRNGH